MYEGRSKSPLNINWVVKLQKRIWNSPRNLSLSQLTDGLLKCCYRRRNILSYYSCVHIATLVHVTIPCVALGLDYKCGTSVEPQSIFGLSGYWSLVAGSVHSAPPTTVPHTALLCIGFGTCFQFWWQIQKSSKDYAFKACSWHVRCLNGNDIVKIKADIIAIPVI